MMTALSALPLTEQGCREAGNYIGDLLELRAVGDGSPHDDIMAEADHLDARLGNRAAKHLSEIVELLLGDGDLVDLTPAAGPDVYGSMPPTLAVNDDLRGSHRHDAGDSPVADRDAGEALGPQYDRVARLNREQGNLVSKNGPGIKAQP